MQVDNWALGVCIYLWTFGRLPFSGASTSEVFDSICNQPLELPQDIAISDALASLITSVSARTSAALLLPKCCQLYSQL